MNDEFKEIYDRVKAQNRGELSQDSNRYDGYPVGWCKYLETEIVLKVIQLC